MGTFLRRRELHREKPVQGMAGDVAASSASVNSAAESAKATTGQINTATAQLQAMKTGTSDPGLKKKEEESYDVSSIALGLLITSLAILVLVYPKLGVVLLLVMTIIALAVSGIQIILAGLRGRRKALSQRHGAEALTRGSVVEQESIAEGRKGIWKSGSWFRDEEKRYVLFRGVNFGSRSKMPPYLPIAPLDVHDISKLDLKKEIESVKTGLDLLKNLGFNIVRLLISWKAIEPRPNPNLEELLPEGRKYLEYMKEIIDELHARNLYVILDFHQDIANEVYGGDGFPVESLILLLLVPLYWPLLGIG